MHVSLFDFHLPEDRIALRPVHPRDEARMLVVPVAGSFEDKTILDLPGCLRENDLLILNDTRVLPARLFASRGQARIELLLHRMLSNAEWTSFARPAKRLRTGDHVVIADDLHAEVLEKCESGEIRLRFNVSGAELFENLTRHGHMPLPPYIQKNRPDDAKDSQDYQTIFSRHAGSVAAPTAGLHFTERLFERLAEKRIGHAFVTLHVGAGTFQPVKVEDTADHVMHREWAQLPAATVAAIHNAKARGGRIIAVGTTALRTLESAAQAGEGKLCAFESETGIFITPGYKFLAADGLLTNFHLPRSTLFMLVSAFSGLERMQAAYAHAIRHHYRFYSYGDACLLWKSELNDLS